MKMKNIHLVFPFALLSLVFMLTISCQEQEKEEEKSEKTVTDMDGNVYHIDTIGTQIWMAENLKTTKYRNGDPITNTKADTEWTGLTTGALCDYDNSPGYSIDYGKLYNWYAVNDSRNIAPTGWHVPTDEDWTILITFLGGESVAGSKLKQSGTANWYSPNTDATNESGFTALPGGCRKNNGIFNEIWDFGRWWSISEFNTISAISRSMRCVNGKVEKATSFKYYGLSVRCVKD
jgi:uncharacterized protein (TIGR02145 family)